MSFESFPFRTNGPTSDTDWGDMWGPVTGTGVVFDSDSSLKVIGDSTGMQVKLLTGRGYVEGHFYRNPSQLTLAIDAASGSPRIDTIVARRSYTAKSVVAAVVKGAPAADPKAPALKVEKTGIWEDALGFVYVGGAAVTIGPSNVTDARRFLESPTTRAEGAFTPEGIYGNAAPTPTVLQGSGVVRLRGLVTSAVAAFSAGTVYNIGSIPLAFAPSTVRSFICNGNPGAVNVVVSTVGAVTIATLANYTGTLGLFLDGCNWERKGA